MWPYPRGTDHAVGDLDEDGLLDLVVTSGPYYGDIFTYMGQGSGGVVSSFGPYQGPFGPSRSGSQHLADVNDDGILDIVACRFHAYTDYGINVLFGTGTDGVGDGGFDPTPVATLLPYALTGLLVEDFDEDGILDAVAWSQHLGGSVAFVASDSVVVLHGTGANGIGDGGFADPTIYRIAGRVYGIVAADFDRDGILDLAVSRADAGGVATTILRGQGANGVGNGVFAPAGVYRDGGSLWAADLTEDGIEDLVSVGKGSYTEYMDTLVVLPGLGDGTFGAAVTIPMLWEGFEGPRNHLIVADFDQDGRNDLLTIHQYGYTSCVVRVGGPALTSSSFAPFSFGGYLGQNAVGPYGVFDFERDGAPNVTGVDGILGDIHIFRAGCAAVPPPSMNLTAPIGGESWQIGTNHTITWTRTHNWPDGVTLESSRDGGANWETIAHDVLGESYVWTVTPPVSTSARVRVRHPLTDAFADVSPSDFRVYATTTAVATAPRGAALTLSMANPNPASGVARFTLEMPSAARIEAVVYDASGRRMRTLARGEWAARGHELSWDGRDETGLRAPAGIYFVRVLAAGSRVERTLVRL